MTWVVRHERRRLYVRGAIAYVGEQRPLETTADLRDAWLGATLEAAQRLAAAASRATRQRWVPEELAG